MNSLIPHFPFLDAPLVVKVYSHYLGRFPTHGEHLWLRNNGNDPWLTNGVCAFTLPDPSKKNLLVYACCHGAQLLEYWLNHSDTRHIRDNYNLVFWLNYRAMQDASYEPSNRATPGFAGIPEEYRELFWASWRKADIIVSHPAYGGTEFDPKHLISCFAKEDVNQLISFHSPSFGALWPVCLFGDDWLKDRMRSGVSAEQFKKALASGALHCCLQARFARAVLRMQKKDSMVDIPIAPFFLTYWRTNRMFITFNHPSFKLMGMQAIRIERSIEQGTAGFFPALCPADEARAVGLPFNACNFQPVWPDHACSDHELHLLYPDSFPDTDGFYIKEIDRCARAVAAEQAIK